MSTHFILPCSALLMLLTCGCSGRDETASQATGGASMTKITLTCPAFGSGQPVPKPHTGEGRDISPPINWSTVPATTREMALIMDDPDAPTPQPWVHWVL